MTTLEAVALSLFAARDRRLLFSLIRVLTSVQPSEDEQPVVPRASDEPLLEWACRCRMPLLTEAQWREDAARFLEAAHVHLERAHHLGIVALSLDDDRYPPLLRAIPDPPPMLWVRGDAAHLLRPAVAVVGSRAATPHGIEMARRLGSDLAAAGLVIVSGLARGIDSAAHAATLAAGGATVAVLACGADRVYPPEHAELARNIRSAGAVVSEFPPGTPPRKHHFPLRNRIISGLAHAVVVVEAPEKSGALITASAAAEQGRDVFVVPGPVATGRNRGGHLLIRDGAKLVESADDILQEIGRPVGSGGRAGGDLNVDRFPKSVDFTVDDVAAHTGERPSVVLARLLELELTGQIQRIGGGRFVRSVNRVLP